MSIRIHELAKKLGMDNKDLMTLLKERDYPAKSVSSTVDNITAEALEHEIRAKRPAEPVPAVVSVAAAPVAEAPKVNLPVGVFVKSVQDVAREREEAVNAAAPPPRPAPVMATAPVAATRPPVPPPIVRPSTNAPVVIKSPVTPPPVPSARPAMSSPPMVSRPPMTAPVPVAKNPIAPPPIPAPAAPRPSAPPPPPSRTGPPMAPAPSSVTVSQNGDIKTIHAKPPIIVRDFAVALGLKPFKLISELMEVSIFASMNQSIDEAVATKLAEKHGFVLEIKHRGEPQVVAPAAKKQEEKKSKEDRDREEDARNFAPRPPVVTILGHVDHGKTSLLDAIRKAEVAAGEAGGITQHIGAYQIEHNGRRITFLDTPGHAAFSKMRARGANVTDIAILVVAADDGFMPQTDEALKHAQDAKVALMVAVNKMDVKGANLDRVKTQMQERNIAPEDWGGETVTVPVAAIKGQGITELLEMILLQADVLELKANAKAEASGVIIESQVDVGRGPLATVIVQRGTLRVGDAIVCGSQWAKVRAMFDDQGNNVKEAPPSSPVRVIGWSGPPDSGARFQAVKNAREAENLAEEEQQRVKKDAVTAAATPKDTSIDALFANIAATQEKVLRVVLKSDVFGSLEAVRNVLEDIKSAKVKLDIVAADVGIITKNDVLMAGASGAVIIGFTTKQENGVSALAKHHSVAIQNFDIIYELGDRVREMMADLLEPDLKEIKLGVADVRQVFPVSKGFVAGCLVTEGKINRGVTSRVRRGKDSMFEGKIGTLRRFKDDANEVRAGLECGIRLDGFDDYKPGDKIECFEVQKVRATL
jgi:translation initiation factor IF-2